MDWCVPWAGGKSSGENGHVKWWGDRAGLAAAAKPPHSSAGTETENYKTPRV